MKERDGRRGRRSEEDREVKGGRVEVRSESSEERKESRKKKNGGGGRKTVRKGERKKREDYTRLKNAQEIDKNTLQKNFLE